MVDFDNAFNTVCKRYVCTALDELKEVFLVHVPAKKQELAMSLIEEARVGASRMEDALSCLNYMPDIDELFKEISHLKKEKRKLELEVAKLKVKRKKK